MLGRKLLICIKDPLSDISERPWVLGSHVQFKQPKEEVERTHLLNRATQCLEI